MNPDQSRDDYLEQEERADEARSRRERMAEESWREWDYKEERDQ